MKPASRQWIRISALAGCVLAAAGVATAEPPAASEPQNATEDELETVAILGQRSALQRISGSAHFLDAEELAVWGGKNIQRALRAVPGVNVQVEDGYGLRPNIGIRGVTTERSSRITLLEDGILIAPAPYSAPSAYYFPTMGRIAALEVLKGPAATTQGPYTIGGAVNLISAPIGQRTGGTLAAEAGNHTDSRLSLRYGSGEHPHLGYLVEAQDVRSDGYQSTDRGGDTGLQVQDIGAKVRYRWADQRQQLALRVHNTTQVSQQTYLGLTDSDFATDAYRRYGLTALDEIDTDHRLLHLRYRYEPSDTASAAVPVVKIAVYRHDFARNWFKTEGLDLDGSADAGSFSRTSWYNIIQAANRGNALDGVTPTTLQAVLDGADTVPLLGAGAIQLRSNAREYQSSGIQANLQWQFGTQSTAAHRLEVGVRMHSDYEDRLQRNSTYDQQGGRLVLADFGQSGNAGNRLQEADALSVHAQHRVLFGKWQLTSGLRLESISQHRTRYETRTGQTANPSSRAAANLRDTRANETDVLLPGLGVSYQTSEQVQWFAGIHEGFTAPTNAPDTEHESALNYEMGVRLYRRDSRLEAVAFLSDYDNLLGICTASSGADCEPGDAFNGDAASVSGLELLWATGWQLASGLTLPLHLTYTYTYTRGTFDTDIASTEFFGDVKAGDPIPHITEHQLAANLGVQAAQWNLHATVQYTGESCTRASCGVYEKTDSTLRTDLLGRYALSEQLKLSAEIENLLGENGIRGRAPYGARPAADTTLTLGVEVSF